jgi:2-C-methyl-D-erythritol 4-phosphate cytidylyltransferase
MNASAIVVAAGSGVRLGLDMPKAFVRLGEQTIVSYSLRTLSRIADVVEIVMAVPTAMREAARAEAEKAGLEIPVKLAPGGAKRQDSVRIALELTSVASELVIVHDAARPFANAQLFEACLRAAARAGAAIAAIPVADTLKRVEQGAITATVKRSDLYQAQTPQVFRRSLLVQAHDFAWRERIAATDDANLVEQSGGRVEIVEGSAFNLKITTPADLKLAEALVASRLVG